MRRIRERGRRASLIVLLALTIAACGDGEDQGGPQSNVATSVPSAGTPAPTNTNTGTNTTPATAPVISGTPSSQALVGQTYAFTPQASNRDGHPVLFSIGNRPSWTTFNSTTGQLSGTPTAANVGTYRAVTIMATASGISTVLTPFDIQVVNKTALSTGTPTNTAPRISGTPAPQALVGQAYTFAPSASDPEGDALLFSIGNRPAWATFNSTTGRLSGTPTAANVGTYTAVTITVTAAGQSTTLPPFNIQVVDNGSKSVTLSWMPPTANDDGTPLLNLAGYRIRYGQQSGSYATSISLNNPGLTSYMVAGLVPSGYYFVISAYNASGTESNYSNEVFANLN